MRSPFLFPLLLLVLTFGSQVIAEDDPAILTLDRIFKDKEFKTEAFSVKWRQKADGYTFIKSAEADGKEIWQFQPGEKEASVMVKSSLSSSSIPVEAMTVSSLATHGPGSPPTECGSGKSSPSVCEISKT